MLYLGFPQRYSEKNVVGPEIYNEGVIKYQFCNPVSHKDIGCEIGAENKEKSFFIWGDSHAGAIAPALDLTAQGINRSGWLVRKGGCLPWTGIEKYLIESEYNDCFLVNEETINNIKSDPNITKVYISGRWHRNYLSLPTESALDELSFYSTFPNYTGRPSKKLFKLGLENTVKTITNEGIEVLIILPVPEPKADVVKANNAWKMTNRSIDLSICPTKSEHYAFNLEIIEFFEVLREKYPNVVLIDPAIALCGPDDYCSIIENNTPLYSDANHLSTVGAKKLIGLFEPTLILQSP